jgi:hypothetical protein
VIWKTYKINLIDVINTAIKLQKKVTSPPGKAEGRGHLCWFDGLDQELMPFALYCPIGSMPLPIIFPSAFYLSS